MEKLQSLSSMSLETGCVAKENNGGYGEIGNFGIRVQAGGVSNNGAIEGESDSVSSKTEFMDSEKLGGSSSNGKNADFAANSERRRKEKEEANAKASSAQKRNSRGNIDLNEQPRKRMKMKKHRPKIYDVTKPVKASVSKPRKAASKPRKPKTTVTPKPNVTPIPTTPTQVPICESKDENLAVPIEEDALFSSRRKLDFRNENCIVDKIDVCIIDGLEEAGGIEKVGLKEDGLSIPVCIIDHSLEEADGIEKVELKEDGLIIPVFIIDQNLDEAGGMENKLEVELKNDLVDDIPVDSLVVAAVCCDREIQNLDIIMESCTMDQNSEAFDEIENKPTVEFKRDKTREIQVYRRRARTGTSSLKKKLSALDETETKSEVNSQLRSENRFTGQVYARRSKKRSCILTQQPSACDGIKNETHVGSICQLLQKGRRSKRKKALVIEKLNEFIKKVHRAQRQKRMKKQTNLSFGGHELKKKSANLRARKESSPATTKKTREVAECPPFERCALKCTWIKRKRSRIPIRRRSMSFFDLNGERTVRLSALFNVKRKRSNTPSRRKDCSILLKYVSRRKKQASSSKPRANRDYVTEALVTYAASKMKSLSIACNQLVVQDQIGHGALMTSAEKPGSTKKRKELPKVDLDPETIRVWDLLMDGDQRWNLLIEDGRSEKNEQEDEREKYWKEQQEIFRGRVELFINRMHMIQGDRRFSQWKGSVVDSVVGVFLTQNVSDHLSSSAFMNIASKYPPSHMNKEDNSGDEKFQEEKLADLRTACEGLKIVENYLTHFQEDGHELEIAQSETEKLKESVGGKEESKINWDDLRTKSSHRSTNRTKDTLDSVDWEAVRKAPVQELANVIMERGMNNIIAQRIKDFLDRLVKDHGSIDLEWLRDAQQEKVKEYLLSITGLGLKSVECVRLLTLRHHAFPVDTNVARILVRLGWVPLQPLPGDIQIHLLNDYPPMDTIQKYIWPRLCFLTKLILYELHYQMITFGKLFCTKRLPNCNACPMRGECRHFASAIASSQGKIEGPKNKNMGAESSSVPVHESSCASDHKSPGAHDHESSTAPSQESSSASDHKSHGHESSSAPNHEPMEDIYSQMITEFYDEQLDHTYQYNYSNCEPVIELPASPEPLYTEMLERDIEDCYYSSGEEIPTIKLNGEDLTDNMKSFLDEEAVSKALATFLDEEAVSKALATLEPPKVSLPMPKLKHAGRLRTMHHVYVLDDSHPLLTGFEKREAYDMCPYLLAIWTPEDLMNSSQESNNQSLASSSSTEMVQFHNDNFVRGTILIPCRTANRGSFPLNGTYFQVNEVFADQESSKNPIVIPREWLWNLTRGTLFCGTSATSICRGMSMEEVIYTFWRGFICIRGFDRSNRAPRPLWRRFHLCKTRKVDEDDV